MSNFQDLLLKYGCLFSACCYETRISVIGQLNITFILEMLLNLEDAVVGFRRTINVNIHWTSIKNHCITVTEYTIQVVFNLPNLQGKSTLSANIRAHSKYQTDNISMKNFIFCAFLLCYPAAAWSEAISNEDIDQYLALLPDVIQPMDAMKDRVLNGDDEASSDAIMKSNIEGHGLRTLVTLVEDEPEFPTLVSAVENGGYDSIEDWALAGDRINSVLFTLRWVAMTDSFGNPDSDITAETNLFEYMKDESKPAEKRQELQDDIDELCAKSCAIPEDLPAIEPRYDDIIQFLDSLEK